MGDIFPGYSVSGDTPRDAGVNVYCIGFAGHMECTSFELDKMLEEDRNKVCNVFGSFLGSGLVVF